MSRLHILHMVRRYGPAGGMERYVWEVTNELAALGHRVEVVCERCYAPHPEGITVHELGEIARRPRWLALLRFGWRAKEWLARNPRPGCVIQSNERLDVHQVTTFHGPPFATVRDKPWWKKLSLRIAMQLWLERRELGIALHIVPNSIFIRQQLAHYYPEFAHKLTAPIVPGVRALPMRDWDAAPGDGGVIGFVGVEWQRKGLPFVVEIVKELRKHRPHLELWVAGPQPQDIRHLFADWDGGYQLLGWRADSDYLARIHVLLHPARAEPFGMAITEAMAAGASVVVSDRCGAKSEIGEQSGSILPLEAPQGEWVSAVESQLQRQDAPPAYTHGWHEVARQYEEIYRKCAGEAG